MSHGSTRVLALLVSAPLVTGCWTETQTVDKTAVSLRSRELPASAPSATVMLSTDGGEARAAVYITRTCQRLTTVQERTVLKRKKRPTAVGYVASGALIGLGVLARTSRGGEAEQVQGVAFLSIVAGAGILAVVAARSGTTETPVGAEQREVPAGTVECGRQPAAGVRVAVRNERGELTGQTGADGIARLDGDLQTLDGQGGEVKVFLDEQPAEHVERRNRARRPAPPPRAPMQPAPLPEPPPRPDEPLPAPPPRPER